MRVFRDSARDTVADLGRGLRDLEIGDSNGALALEMRVFRDGVGERSSW
jgi:hypothetical protein